MNRSHAYDRVIRALRRSTFSLHNYKEFTVVARVLIVDDNVDNNVVLRLLIEHACRVPVEAVATISEAQRALDAGDIGFAVVDVNLGPGGGDSNAFSRTLNAYGIPYVRLTGNPDSVPEDVRGLEVLVRARSGTNQRLLALVTTQVVR
ncbi:MAG: hypothetical protein KDD44_05075 [Bdellovibrionales bacterium]|nr:hypothetical protein [Bdellovibrionales bacterium]